MPVRRHRATFLLVVAAALLVATLAGCLGDRVDDPEARPARTAQPHTITLGGTPRRVTFWANDTFRATENQMTSQASGSHLDRVDLDDEIPDGVPTRIEATLSYPTSPRRGAVVDHLEVRLAAPNATVHRRTNTDDAVPQNLTALLVANASSSPALEVVHQYPQADDETPYTLRIQVSVRPALLPAEVPVAVPVPEAADRLVLHPASDDLAPVVAEGPHGDLLGPPSRGKDGVRTFALEGAGEHVVTASGPFRAEVETSTGEPVDLDGTARLLGTTAVLGQRQGLAPGGGPTTWTFTPDRPPIQVGFREWSTGPAELGHYTGAQGTDPGVRFTFRSAEGVVLDYIAGMFGSTTEAYAGGFRGGGFTIPGPTLPQNLTAGRYELTVRYDSAAEMEVAPRWVVPRR